MKPTETFAYHWSQIPGSQGTTGHLCLGDTRPSAQRLRNPGMLALACLAIFCLVGCEPPDEPDGLTEAAPQPEVKKPAVTPYGKAMEAATNLRDKKVPE